MAASSVLAFWLVALVLIDYAWVTWHFASQHFGALSLYRSRAGRAACVQTRRFDRLFALVVGGAHDRFLRVTQADAQLRSFPRARSRRCLPRVGFAPRRNRSTSPRSVRARRR